MSGRVRHRIFLVAIAGALAASGVALPEAVGAQEARSTRIRPSQEGSVTQKVGTTEITITYSRPVARGRDLFPGVVSWGRVWNPGADSATTITFDKDVTINGESLPAGSYTLWLIPADREPWTVIFSRAVHIWHTPYPAGQDALRLTVTPKTGEHMETLAYYFHIVDRTDATLHFHWGTVVVPLEIRTTI